MYKEIKQRIAEKNYVIARQLLDDFKNREIYDAKLAVLDAIVYREMGEWAKMYLAIVRGLKVSPCDYELFYWLGMFYLSSNINQAFLCFENALFYCDSEDDYLVISSICDEIKRSPLFKVHPVSIVIVSYNCNYLMKMNIKSIRETLNKDSYQIVVIDNASTDGIAEWLEQQEDVWLVRNATNVGFAPACNQGVQLCNKMMENENEIFLLNNDTRLTQNALFWMRMGLYEDYRVGATGAVSNYAGNMQQLDVLFSTPKEYLSYAEKNNVPMIEPYEERVRLSGFALLIRRDVWNEIGGMDEAFAPGYFEDDDLCMRVAKAGYMLRVCKNSFIYHAGSQSFSKNKNVNELLMNHYQLFIDKYGFPINDYAYPCIDFSHYIKKDKWEKFFVLDIGCALGANIMKIEELYPNAVVIGIENDENIWKYVYNKKKVYQSLDSFLTENQMKDNPIIFDYVLFLNEKNDQTLLHQIMDNTDLFHHNSKLFINESGKVSVKKCNCLCCK